MALFVSMKEGVLVVRDELLSFDGTQVSWWYHDLENRTSSSDGKEGGELDRPMDDDAYAWIAMHYLPLLRDGSKAAASQAQAQVVHVRNTETETAS